MGKGQRIDIKSFRNGFENHPVSIAVSAYKVEDDRMIFTKGDVTGAFVDADGNEVHLSDFRGTPVVLNFWASW